ncbi:signal peptidase II [Candidatus Micrarchaeota archaeon]|jgi:signal peptidase II|nr:signal peptidase II [Candidatus Micrarchaeota archaeon]
MPSLLFMIIFLLVLAADQLSKWWIISHFALYESREIIPGFFNFTFLTNNGAAFSILAGQPAVWRQVFFVTVNAIALVVIWIAQRRFGQGCRLYTTALALIAGGAAGNMVDRLRFAYVVDFLDVYIGTAHWPAFNIADAAINVGVALFLLNSLVLEPRRDKKTRIHASSA